jgi:hypothetical protein
VGPIGILLGLPLLVWASAFYCNAQGWPVIPKGLPSWADVKTSFSLEVFAVYVAWWVFQAALHVLVPGHDADGVLLRDGSRLKYRINGACAGRREERAEHLDQDQRGVPSAGDNS